MIVLLAHAFVAIDVLAAAKKSAAAANKIQKRNCCSCSGDNQDNNCCSRLKTNWFLSYFFQFFSVKIKKFVSNHSKLVFFLYCVGKLTMVFCNKLQILCQNISFLCKNYMEKVVFEWTKMIQICVNVLARWVYLAWKKVTVRGLGIIYVCVVKQHPSEAEEQNRILQLLCNDTAK